MKPELLLPVGNSEMCQAAVHYGADAVYIGAPYFNARKRTTDFTVEELKQMVDYCHLYGVKVNLAFNVVIFENEIQKVKSLLEQVLLIGVDAIIVQDLGLVRLIKMISPSQKIHASTQMTVTNSDAIEFLSDLGMSRFVLARENSLSEIKLIKEKTNKELEVFVHGALCVAYSGQCFTSESIGGRSANRGQCAQSCRLDYELWVDDKKQEMGEKKYFVSPKDLLGLGSINELMEIGVDSFKVEGRLKTPEYVATAAKNYREVIEGEALRLNQRTLDLSTTYSRGFFSGWLGGVDHQNLVDGTYSAHRGFKAGKVQRIQGKKIFLKSDIDLKPGMGILFSGKKEIGSKIFLVKKIKEYFEVELLNKSNNPDVGTDFFINSNESHDQIIRKGWTQKENLKKIPLQVTLSGEVSGPLKIEAKDPDGRIVEIFSDSLLEMSKNDQKDLIKNELSSLSTTAFVLEKINFSMSSQVFIHQKELKKMRRSLVEKMNELRIKRNIDIRSVDIPTFKRPSSSKTKLNLLFRTIEQVEGFISQSNLERLSSYRDLLGDIILDFEFGKNYALSLEMLRESGFEVVIATTRILKPSEYYNLKQIIRLNPSKVLVRNLGAFHYLKQHSNLELLGDFSLNVTNSLTADYLVHKGFQRLNLSYDLNQDQLIDLIKAYDPSKLEVTIHQYMPEFHMEHCVFAAFLSKGSSFKDCGKPCEKHSVKLKDPYGNWHHLKADHECRNTFFKATPQSASFLVNELKQMGLGSIRLEALSESSVDLNDKVFAYLKLLSGEYSSDDLMKNLKIKESYGLATGQLEKSDDYKDRKKSKEESLLF